MNPVAATRWDKCSVCGFEKAGIRMDQGGLAISPNGRYVLYAGGRDTGQLRIMDVTNPSDPLTVHVEPLGLHKLELAAAMGVAFRGDVFYVAAGALSDESTASPASRPSRLAHETARRGPSRSEKVPAQRAAGRPFAQFSRRLLIPVKSFGERYSPGADGRRSRRRRSVASPSTTDGSPVSITP